MISIIITTYKESNTLSKAIQAILDQNLEQEYEILVVGPDRETENIVKNFQVNHPEIQYLKDKGIGKPAALNLAFKNVRGDILILTDGDVWIERDAIRNLLKFFEIKKNGAVSGRPISINPRNNLFGYWSHFLTEAAHQMRLKRKQFPCSGYLYAIRNIIKEVPENVLSEDAFITQIIRNQGYEIVYAPEAKVYVKYPDNFKDWLKQKIRTTGGYIQELKIKKTRSFWQEIIDGIKLFFSYPRNLKEFWWIILLFLARIYLWLLIFWKIKIKKEKFANIWRRVESTK